MPDRPAISGRPPATAVGGRPGGDGAPHGRVRAVWAVARRVLTGRPVRWGFGAAAVAIGGYAVAREWTDVRAALASIGALMVAAAMVSVLIAMFAAMQVWRVLLAALGSPLPIRVAARILFVGQLGKYVPGSVWPVLAQMELGNAHRVPRHHSASASVLTMLVSMFSGLLTALVTLPFFARSTPYLWAFLAAPGLLACLHPKVLNSVLGRLFRLDPASPARAAADRSRDSHLARLVVRIMDLLRSANLAARDAARRAPRPGGAPCPRRLRLRLDRGFRRRVRAGRGRRAGGGARRLARPGDRRRRGHRGGLGLPCSDHHR